MSLVHNEQIKLSANLLNTLASGVVITGAVAPVVAVLFGFPIAAGVTPGLLWLSAVAWILLGASLHFVARRLLRRLKP